MLVKKSSFKRNPLSAKIRESLMLLHQDDPRLLPVEDAVAARAAVVAVKAVAVAVAVEKGEKMVKAVADAVAAANAVMVVKVVAVAASAVMVVKVVAAVVSVVIAETVRAAEEAAPELKVAMAKAALKEAEVASPDKIDLKASLVKKTIQWTDRTALVVAAVAIARTVIAEADGAVLTLRLNQTRRTR